jgi:hypothetical protein
MVTSDSRAFWAMPALLIRMSIWRVPSGREKVDLTAWTRAAAPDWVPMSAWTGRTRMEWVDWRVSASSVARAVEEGEA